MFGVHTEVALPWTHHFEGRYQYGVCKTEDNKQVANIWDENWTYVSSGSVQLLPRSYLELRAYQRPSVQRFQVEYCGVNAWTYSQFWTTQATTTQTSDRPDDRPWAKLHLGNRWKSHRPRRNVQTEVWLYRTRTLSDSSADHSQIRNATMLHKSSRCMVVYAVEHFRMFLLGKEFLLRTDHSALRNVLQSDLPPTTLVERWILRLSEYTFRIE